MAEEASGKAMSDSKGQGRSVRRWVRRAARVGHLSVGVLYVLVGILAIAAAIDPRREPTDSVGALRHLLTDRLGGLVAVGLMCGLIIDAVWQGVRAFTGAGRGLAGLLQRVMWLGSGVLHLGVAVVGIRIIAGALDLDADATVRWWSSSVLAAPYGDWILGLAAGVVIAIALAMVYRAWTGETDDALDRVALSDTAQWVASALARVGLAARAVACGVAGGFLLLAAAQHDPTEARGLAGTFRGIRYETYGAAVLGLLAIGFIANGIVELLRARFRRRSVS